MTRSSPASSSPTTSSLRLPQPASELAARLGGKLAGQDAAARTVAAIKALHEAGPADLSFCESSSFLEALERSCAGVVVVPQRMAGKMDRAHIAVGGSPRAAIATLLEAMSPAGRPEPGAHPTAAVDASAQVAADASVGPGAVVGAHASVGSGAVLRANAVLGERCCVGARSVLAEGSVVGGQGFGFVEEGGKVRRFPHQGRVVIGEDVEVGANSCIDRGALGDTTVGDRTKIDNLVQIGHNVRIGSDCILCGCVAIAGSAVLGNGCSIGGAACIKGHIELADGVQVMGMTAVLNSITEPGEVYGGPIPAMPKVQVHRLYKRILSLARGRGQGK